jgi:hypothetical protein
VKSRRISDHSSGRLISLLLVVVAHAAHEPENRALPAARGSSVSCAALPQLELLQLAVVDELQARDVEIGSRLAHELLVRAALHDPAALHHDDEVGAAQRAEPVRDDERRAARNRAVERFENLVLGLAVDRRGRIVEQQDGGSSSTARAIARRWRWPPERLLPLSPSTVS